MIEEILNKAKNQNARERDSEIDNLSTLLECGQLSISEQIHVVEELLNILFDESDPIIIESIFNLIGIAFDNGVCSDAIVNSSVKMLHKLEPNSLVHAIPIISFSKLENRKALIEPFLLSSSAAVRREAEEALQA